MLHTTFIWIDATRERGCKQESVNSDLLTSYLDIFHKPRQKYDYLILMKLDIKSC
jgi:hypothetical protein